MRQLAIRTEYSFGSAYGAVEKIAARLRDSEWAGIADENGTWGHVSWDREIRKAGLIPGFGTRLRVVPDTSIKAKGTPAGSEVIFLARSSPGLLALYNLVTEATHPDRFYYRPRIDWDTYNEVIKNKDILVVHHDSPDIERFKFQENVYGALSPIVTPRLLDKAGKFVLPASDNYYISPEDNTPYQIFTGRNAMDRPAPMWIVDTITHKAFPEAQKRLNSITKEMIVELPVAGLVHFPKPVPLRKQCLAGAKRRGIDLKDKVYKDRLERELALIAEKQFEDYFYVIIDMIAFAKKHMLVGPARGSSCGSLVCYLTGITDIDPIPFGLLFERFIDLNRKDLPDIDIDFADNRRDMVFQYVKDKYGPEQVARLGSINKFQPKSAISLVAKATGIPLNISESLKSAIVERSSGDSRATFAIADTLNELDIGKRILADYPEVAYAASFEGHASHSGQHAAGIVVTAKPVRETCSIDLRNGVAMLDKYDAERVNLLKIDALGLRTLSIIQDCLDDIGLNREELLAFPLDDPEAFDTINRELFTGVFQFEGYALQSLARQIKVTELNDLVAITALARPGPLNSGSATKYLARQRGEERIEYEAEIMKQITGDTYGIVIYQEQVMQCARLIGQLSWEDTSTLRKAMSRSMGKEFFDQYWTKFREGAVSQGISENVARSIWDKINTFGSWAFNKSHAVAYGLVSYWCCYLKAHYPVEWTLASLKHAKDEDQTLKILREHVRRGHKYIPVDPERSAINWKREGNLLIGGLTNIKGLGEKKAEGILRKRAAGLPLAPGEAKLLAAKATPYDNVNECRDMWAHIFKDPIAHNVMSPLTELENISERSDGTYCFIAKTKERNLRDANELSEIQKRGGKKLEGPTKFLNLTFEDDTSQILAKIDRYKFEAIGRIMIEQHRAGDYYIVRGGIRAGWRKIYIQRIRYLGRRKLNGKGTGIEL